MTELFDKSSEPPPDGSIGFHTDQWESVRDSGIPPRDVSVLGDSQRDREEFLHGLGLMRLDGPRAKRDKRTGELMTPRPAQLMIADAVAGADRFMGLLAPRRSTKSSALFAIALGRVASREDYRVGVTLATLALKARARFKEDIAAPLEMLYPDKKSRPFTISYAGGSEAIRWLETSSVLQFGAPKGDFFRSDAWDMLIIDEAGSSEPEMTEDLLAGALATMDTIPDALLIAAGTAGQLRAGNLLFETLADGRAGKNRTSILAYAAPTDTTVDDILTEGERDWDKASALLLVSHPGVGNGTELEDLRPNFEKMKPERFAAEYLGVFGQVGAASFLDQVKFAKGHDKGELPEPPEHFTMAFQVHLDSTTASIVAAWRDKDGRASWLELYHGAVRGLFKEQTRLAVKYRMPVAYDSGQSATLSEAQKLERARPRPRLLPQNWRQVATAASLAVKEIEAENVTHWGQEHLLEAVRLATKRGTRDSKMWAFGRPSPDDDIIALEAASIALRAFDENPPRVALRPVSVA
jgi:hypothetical protein